MESLEQIFSTAEIKMKNYMQICADGAFSSIIMMSKDDFKAVVLQ